MSEPYLNVDELKALVPWREWELPHRHIAAATGIFVGLILISWLIDGGDVDGYLAAAAAMAVLLPVGLLLIRYLLTTFPWTPPLAMNREGIVAPTVWWGSSYVPWTEVYLIAHVHSLVGRSLAPIERNLLVYRKGKRPIRLSLPPMPADEFTKLGAILERIAELHNIELVYEDAAGQRRLRNLPWFF